MPEPRKYSVEGRPRSAAQVAAMLPAYSVYLVTHALKAGCATRAEIIEHLTERERVSERNMARGRKRGRAMAGAVYFGSKGR